MVNVSTLSSPYGLAIDAAGNIYIANKDGNSISEMSASTGTISTIAGDGVFGPSGYCGFSGDGGLATSAALCAPNSVAVDAAGNIYISDAESNRIRAVGAPNMILGAAQLNATANVPGTFWYTPPAGTALTPGSQMTLSTVFTPTDTINYTTATASVTLTVNLGTPSLRFAPIPAQTYGANPFVVSATSNSTGVIT
jgi:sugar lactone lactonase YvrE